MPKSSNQKLKLLYLSRIFLENTDSAHAMTLKELSDALAKYEISAERKSLYDDIEMLRVFGLDICVIRDRQVRYYVGSHDFELAELKLLVDAVQSSKFITEKKSNSLIRKLEGLCSKYEAAQLHRQVTVSNRLKAANEEIFCNVDMIHRAISENRKICFRYFEWTPEKKRALRREGAIYRISPWALTWDDENYYMIGYDSEAQTLKHYRVDKMLELYMDKSAREGEKDFSNLDMTQYSKQVFGMYGGELCNVRLSCDKSLAGVVIDRFGTDIVIANHGERFEFTVKVMISPTFYSWVLGFGNKVKVVSPDYVRDRVTEIAHEVVAAYGADDL
ncbi:MAG: WYL domain-containing protein [Clostridia bacterium]|nr:WYL domain-containing protein [Clostridia bacterium]